MKTALTLALLFSTSAALAGEVTYSAGMKPEAIAADKANRAALLTEARPAGVKDVWCLTQDYRYGRGFGWNYIGSDPDPNVRLALLRACINDGNSVGRGG